MAAKAAKVAEAKMAAELRYGTEGAKMAKAKMAAELRKWSPMATKVAKAYVSEANHFHERKRTTFMSESESLS